MYFYYIYKLYLFKWSVSVCLQNADLTCGTLISFFFFIYVYIFDYEITIFGLLLASILMCPSSGGPKINFIELKLIKCLICDSFSVIFLSLVTNIKTQFKQNGKWFPIVNMVIMEIYDVQKLQYIFKLKLPFGLWYFGIC